MVECEVSASFASLGVGICHWAIRERFLVRHFRALDSATELQTNLSTKAR
jgi:hypothetical protein